LGDLCLLVDFCTKAQSMTKIQFGLNRTGGNRTSSKLKLRITLKGPKQLNDEGNVKSCSRRIEPAMPIGPVPIKFFDKTYNKARVEFSLPDSTQRRRYNITDSDVRGWNSDINFWRNKVATKLEEITNKSRHRSWYSFDEMDEFEKWIKSELGNSTSRPEGVLSADIRIVASHVVNALKDQKHWPSSASRQFKSGYINQYSALLNVLNRFIEDEAVMTTVSELDISWWNQYCDWLRKNYSESTSSKHTERLKKVLDESQNALKLPRDYNRWRPIIDSTPPKTNQFFTRQQLKHIKTLEFQESDKHLEKYRDWILLGSYLGARVGDWKSWTRARVEEVQLEDGSLACLMVINEEKHTKTIHRKVTSEIRDVIGDDHLWPNLPTDQKCNKYFKEVCKKADFNELVESKGGMKPFYQTVTTHFCRKTFATLYAQKTMPQELSRLMGHSNTSVTDRYVQIEGRAAALKLPNLID
jgi:integrase